MALTERHLCEPEAAYETIGPLARNIDLAYASLLTPPQLPDKSEFSDVWLAQLLEQRYRERLAKAQRRRLRPVVLDYAFRLVLPLAIVLASIGLLGAISGLVSGDVQSLALGAYITIIFSLVGALSHAILKRMALTPLRKGKSIRAYRYRSMPTDGSLREAA